MSTVKLTYANDRTAATLHAVYAFLMALGHREASQEFEIVVSAIGDTLGDRFDRMIADAESYFRGPSKRFFGRLGKVMVGDFAGVPISPASLGADAEVERVLRPWADKWLCGSERGYAFGVGEVVVRKLGAKKTTSILKGVGVLFPEWQLLLGKPRRRAEQSLRREADDWRQGLGFRELQRRKLAKWARIWFRVRVLRVSQQSIAGELDTSP